MSSRFAKHPLAWLTIVLFVLVAALGVALSGASPTWTLYLSQGCLALGCSVAILRAWGPGLPELFRRPSSRWGVTSVLVSLLLSAILVATDDSASESLGQALRASLSTGRALGVFVLAPLFEEAYFRGLLLASLGQAWAGDASPLAQRPNGLAFGEGGFWAVYISALAFFVFHIPFHAAVWSEAWALGGVPINIGPFGLGLWCGFIAWKDRSLWFAIAAHALANLFAAPWAIVFSGLWL